MRTAICLLTVTSLPLFSLSARDTAGCPEIEKTAQKYFTENYGSDDEKPAHVPHKIIRINNAVAAVQFSAPEDREDKEAKRQVFTAFFGGKEACTFLQQADGEIADILDAGSTKYVFVRTESDEGDMHHTDDFVVTATAAGEVTPTRDQHGSDIFFQQSMLKRCEGKVGEATLWTRDANDSQRITVRVRHTDRDGKCRITEDSSHFRYYRLAADLWQLDDHDEDIITETTVEDAPPVTQVKAGNHKR